MIMEKYYRIRTNISKDQVVRANLTQDIDFLEILSLKIKQEDTYKLHASNYGIIIGRVLANDAFGIPNAKVSVFIPLDDSDKFNSEISSIYPYTSIQSKDSNNRRYNLLLDDSNDECYRVVGTFPNKRLVLDNNTEIQIFEKYWKYTTVTNKSGDYMIFGVPTGNNEVHVDVDLSDIGVLSQKPRDFLYKGYNITQFDNANQFKESTNLDNLSQLLSQTSSVHVYPFWGDKDMGEIAITRCDLQVQYKFEPTCVFFGSIVSDNFSTSIGDKCNFSETVGFNRNLVAGEGTIEMIRKTVDGLIEEFQIQGNRLIDGNGVWCYQIPMNLDYVGTDEFGNIVPVDNPNKGIPTRTSVRFRISMQESSNEGVSRHRAKYLVPNIHPITSSSNYRGNIGDVAISEPNKYNQCYEFGSATPDEFFRDLYWNKVYSVKNYIPRLQLDGSKNTQKYTAIRTVNSSGNLNPFPFNHARFKLYFSYRVICMLMRIVIKLIGFLNKLISIFNGIRIFGKIDCMGFSFGITDDNTDGDVEYFPDCKKTKYMKCSKPGCIKKNNNAELFNNIEQSLSQEYDTVNLDFYNDWINGCLYMPLWFWKKTKKKKFLFGLFSKKAINRYCNCDSNYRKLRITENCSLHTDYNYLPTDTDRSNEFHNQFPDNTKIIGHGIIKEVENKDGLKIYYYAPGVPSTNDYRDTTATTVPYTRLYSTDIILLGSLNNCDLDNLPQAFANLPSSTANIPYINTLKDSATDNNTEFNDVGVTEVTGMDWLTNSEYNAGLFMDLSCTEVQTKPKTCINLARMSELGVTLDTRYYDAISSDGVLKYDNERPADGLITRYELIDPETRAMFASLNHNGLQEKVKNPNTGYDTYKLIYNYSTDFDGHLNKYSVGYTANMKVKTYDNQDLSYVDFIFGIRNKLSDKMHFYSLSQNGNQMPLFNNSFYFYFGLNEGNTAIDKFNNLFYAKCFKNYKYPFTMTYNVTPAKWCKEYDNIDNPLEVNKINDASGLTTDYATIDVTLKSITLPYKYILYDEFNVEIMSEDNVYLNELRFGYSNKSNSKYGVLTYSKDNSIVTFINANEIECAYLLDNGNYKLKIIDNNGNSVIQPISINQTQISVSTTIIGLGDKYYDGVTIESDLCNEAANYGEIIIDNIVIDGKNYLISEYNINNLKDNSYDLLCYYFENVDGHEIKQEYKILLTIEPQFDINKFDTCICHGYYEPSLKSGKLYFKVWIPGDYKLTIIQYCNGVLNDNLTTDTINIANGKPFLTYINDVPLRFIIGNNNNLKNNHFYSKIADTIITENNSISGWFSLDEESVYNFEGVESESNMNVWEDFINIGYIVNDDGEKIDIDSSSKLNIIEYKFNCLMGMSNSNYIIDSSEKDLRYHSSGGKDPILYRGFYPLYEEFTNESLDFNDAIYDSDSNVTCLSNIPNIVTSTYAKFDSTNNVWVSYYDKTNINNMKPNFNPLFKNSPKLGNYFAAYTSNAGYNYENGNWVENDSIRFQSNPYNTDSLVRIVSPGDKLESFSDSNEFMTVYGYDRYNSYFRDITLDRRLDYAYFMILPIYHTNITLSSSDNVWKNGRLVGYQYNGVEMCYDKNYNIVGAAKWDNNSQIYTYGDVFEYYLPSIYVNDSDTNIISCFSGKEKLKVYHNTSNQNKKFYSSSFRTSKYYDIKNCFWAEDRRIDINRNDDLRLNDYNLSRFNGVNDVFSLTNYPTIRGLDIYNFDKNNKYTFNVISCNYDTNLEIIDNGSETYNYNAIIDEGEEVNFNIGGNNSIVISEKNFDESVTNGYGDIIYNNTRDSTSIAIFSNITINFSFKILQDTINDTHNNFIYLPYLYIDTEDSLVTKLTNIKNKILVNSNLSSVISDIMNEFSNSNQLTYSNLSSTDSTFNSEIESTNSPIHNDIFDIKNSTYLRHKTSLSILYSDEILSTNISYNINLSGNYNFKKILMIYYLKRYLNNTEPNLCRDILTFNIGDMMMVGPGNMTCLVYVMENIQITSFELTLDNFEIHDVKDITVSFKYENIIAQNITLNIRNGLLHILVKWDTNLANILLVDEPKVCGIYLKLPNGIINKFNFKLNKNGFMK